MISYTLTVLFDDPFWIGLFEIVEHNHLAVAKVTFGTEPKDQEVYAYILRYIDRLSFSPAVSIIKKEVKKNPKRIQKEVNKQLKEKGIGTKSQQALKLQLEANKEVRRIQSKEEKRLEQERQFELRQQKKREKHKGH